MRGIFLAETGWGLVAVTVGGMGGGWGLYGRKGGGGSTRLLLLMGRAQYSGHTVMGKSEQEGSQRKGGRTAVVVNGGHY